MTLTQRRKIPRAEPAKRVQVRNLAERVRFEEDRLADRYRTQLSIYHSLMRDRYTWSLLCAFPFIAFLLAGSVSLIAQETLGSVNSELASIHALSATLTLGALFVGVRAADPAQKMAHHLSGAKREIISAYLFAIVMVVCAVSGVTIFAVVLILLAPQIYSEIVNQAIPIYFGVFGVAVIYSLIGICVGLVVRSVWKRLASLSLIWATSMCGLVLFPVISERFPLMASFVYVATPGVLSGQIDIVQHSPMVWGSHIAALLISVPLTFVVVQKMALSLSKRP